MCSALLCSLCFLPSSAFHVSWACMWMGMAVLHLMEDTAGLKESWHFGDSVFRFEKESTLPSFRAAAWYEVTSDTERRDRVDFYPSRTRIVLYSQGFPARRGLDGKQCLTKTSFLGVFLTHISNRSHEHNYFLCTLLDCFLSFFFFSKRHSLINSKKMILTIVQGHHSISRNLWNS